MTPLLPWLLPFEMIIVWGLPRIRLLFFSFLSNHIKHILSIDLLQSFTLVLQKFSMYANNRKDTEITWKYDILLMYSFSVHYINFPHIIEFIIHRWKIPAYKRWSVNRMVGSTFGIMVTSQSSPEEQNYTEGLSPVAVTKWNWQLKEIQTYIG